MEWNIGKRAYPDRLRRIILDLAENGSATGYSLADRTKLPRSSTYDGLKILHRQGFVEDWLDPEWGGPLKKKENSLTVRGFSAAVMLADPETLRRFPAAWPELLPLVTGKWNLFVETGVEDLALPRLKWSGVAIAIPELIERLQQLHQISASDSLTDEEKITQIFYDPEAGFKNLEERKRWAKACARDSEVRIYFDERLKEAMGRNESHARELRIMAEALKDKTEEVYVEAGRHE